MDADAVGLRYVMRERFSPEDREKKLPRLETADTSPSQQEKITSPYTEGLVATFNRQFGPEATESRQAMVREIADTFFKETLQNIDLRGSEKHGVKYPWGMIDTGTLTKKIYEKVTGKQIGPLKKPEHPVKKRKEFIFGSVIFPMHGTPFAYQEEALHQFIQTLQRGIDAIEKGEEPDTTEVYTLGSPTNFLGTVSKQFSDEIHEEGAFEAFAAPYVEHIEEILKKDTADYAVHLHGVSIGGTLAVTIAQGLLEQSNDHTRLVTQDEAEDKPKLHVRIDHAPASSHTPPGLKAVQTALGFAMHGLHDPHADAYLASVWGGEEKFVADVNKVLAARNSKPMTVETSPEQMKMKQKALRALVGNLLKGKEIPEGLKVTEVVGLDDLLTFSPLFELRAGIQRATRENSLQRYLVAKEAKGTRKRYGIAEPHTGPLHRPNKLKLLNRAAELLERARAGSRVSKENPGDAP